LRDHCSINKKEGWEIERKIGMEANAFSARTAAGTPTPGHRELKKGGGTRVKIESRRLGGWERGRAAP